MKNIFLVVLLLDVVPSLCAMSASEEKGAPRAQLPEISPVQSAIDVLGGSRLVSRLTQWRAAGVPIPQERVPPELERMWEKAQNHVGVLPQFRVPIRYQEGQGSAAFSMKYGFLCVASEEYERYSRAFLKQRLLHEARHHLLNDFFMVNNFPAVVCCASYSIGALSLIYGSCNNENLSLSSVTSCAMVNFGVAIGLKNFLENHFAGKPFERRAEIQAAYDLGCKKCIGECALSVENGVAYARETIGKNDQFVVPGCEINEKLRKDCQSILKDFGGGNSPYLSGAEFVAIAEQVLTVCEDHRSKSRQLRALTFDQAKEDRPYSDGEFLHSSGQSRILTSRQSGVCLYNRKGVDW